MRRKGRPELEVFGTAKPQASERNDFYTLPQTTRLDRRARERRARALLRAAERLQLHYPDSAALATYWARDAI